MVRWSLGLTILLIAILTAIGTVAGGRSTAFRVAFFLVLALWQGALTVAIFTRRRTQARADCLGIGLISVLVTVVYVLIRYRMTSMLVLVWIPGVVVTALAGAWLAWNASRKRA